MPTGRKDGNQEMVERLRPKLVTLAERSSSESPHGRAVTDALAERRADLDASLAALQASSVALSEAADALIEALLGGRKVLAAGNGGSASQAQHFVAELVGRFKLDRAPYSAITLCTDSAVLTALGNDYGYEQVFARQVTGLGQPGDVLVVFSTSGASENLVRAVEAARNRGMSTIAIAGTGQCPLARQADIAVVSPEADAAVIQELHLVITHVLCQVVESQVSRHGFLE